MTPTQRINKIKANQERIDRIRKGHPVKVQPLIHEQQKLMTQQLRVENRRSN